MKLVIEYIDGTKDVMNTNWDSWEVFRKIVNNRSQINSLDFVNDKGVPMWVPATAIKRIYPK
jgi:hypothetical protein